MFNVLFRANGGPEIGWGHLMRCRTLAVELQKKGWQVCFAGLGFPTLDFKGLNGSPFDFMEIVAAESQKADALITSDIACRKCFDLIVVDHYGYSFEDFKVLRKSGAITAAIDDLGDRVLPVDIVVNPNPLVSPAVYAKSTPNLILTGEKYTFIRPEILALKRLLIRTNSDLLICLGGGDVEYPTVQVLGALPEMGERKTVVSVTSDCPIGKLEMWAKSDPSKRILNTDSAKLPRLISESALAITGGGTTLWEIYYFGVPSIAMVWADNQRNTLDVIGIMETSFLLDGLSEFNVQSLRNAVDRLLHNSEISTAMVHRQRELIDGQGVFRVAAHLEKYIEAVKQRRNNNNGKI